MITVLAESPAVDAPAVRAWVAAVRSHLLYLLAHVGSVYAESSADVCGAMADAVGEFHHLGTAAEMLEVAASELAMLDDKLAERLDASLPPIPELTAAPTA